MLGTAACYHQYILGGRFFKTYFLDILFSGAYLLRTLSIFRLEKVLVWMVHNRKFQPQRFLIFWFL